MSAPVLKSNRLILRGIETEDSKNIKYLLKPEIESVSGPYMPHSEEQLAIHIDRIKGDTSWGITLSNGDFIGDIAVFSVVDNKIGEIAWYIDPSFWCQGYAFEAAGAVLEYVFDTLGFIRVSAQISANNQASRRLAEKLGFVCHGILPDANFGGKIDDVAYYSKTKEIFK